MQTFEAKNPVEPAINTGLAMRRSAQELENMKYTADNIQASTAKTVSEENMNKVKLQILSNDLSPAELAKLRADLDKEAYSNKIVSTARKVGTGAEEISRTTNPILNSAKKVVDTIQPFRSFNTERTRSGTRFDKYGEENHYQDTTFEKRFHGF